MLEPLRPRPLACIGLHVTNQSLAHAPTRVRCRRQKRGGRGRGSTILNGAAWAQDAHRRSAGHQSVAAAGLATRQGRPKKTTSSTPTGEWRILPQLRRHDLRSRPLDNVALAKPHRAFAAFTTDGPGPRGCLHDNTRPALALRSSFSRDGARTSRNPRPIARLSFGTETNQAAAPTV
jgi:hypothetical protein